ncbi:MAG: VrrA/YqfQ family protein [Mesobacillus sp.]|uniref:VrrA/YqfQ family protein n=1 Tax=Mesobacillus sp. TaxID=2675271 RepID=UPI003C42305E
MLQGPRMNSHGMQPHHYIGPGYMGSPAMHPRQIYPNQFGQRPGIQQGQFGPRMGRNPQSRQGGGGLLAKLLGKGGRGQSNALPGFLSQGGGTARAASSGGGILKTLTDPSALNGFLNNTQQVLKTAQQFGPMIQQYGPLVRNIPSMWKLYKGLKDLPDAEDQSEQEVNEVKEETASEGKDVKTASSKAKRKPAARKTSAKQQSPKGSSSPKLFY